MTISPTPTPGHTVGPFFHDALSWAGGESLVPPGSAGAVGFTGRVLDGGGDPVPDALLEIWQADATGSVPRAAGSLRRDVATFTGFGRSATDANGRFNFTTVRPGPTGDGSLPFIALAVFARGLLNRLFTRAYLPAGPDLRARDPLLGRLDPAAAASLLLREDGTGLHFDVHLQGERQTTFLTFPRHLR